MEVARMSLFALLGSLLQLASGADSCAAQPQALKDVAHRFWLGYNQRDTSLLATVLDDDLLLVPAAGTVTTKPELLAHITAPLEPTRSLLTFRRRWMVTHEPSGVAFKATSRMTEVFVCRGTEWKVLAFQETVIPNAERPVSAAASARYGDYVGRYRFGSKGDGALIVVTRKGGTLDEAWGADKPAELLPGKFDGFFTRGFSIEERFLRDSHGRVVGILYTMGDSEIEARRVP
jgi:hypothetical protein